MIAYVPATPAMSKTTDSHFCSACGYKAQGETSICLNCGAALDLKCSICQQFAPAGSKFCGQCGAHLLGNKETAAANQRHDEVKENLRALMPKALANKISAASGEILGENREVTILAVKITNSADDMQPLDDEDSYYFTNKALRLLVEVVYKYEGTIDKLKGDGLVAFFGAPIAHENDPERAVRAALEMQKELRRWQSSGEVAHHPAFQTQIGLDTGLVIAGKIGNDLHMEYTVVGETINLVYQLQNSAGPDAVLVSAETYQRTRSQFEYETLAPVSVDWLPHTVQVYRPLGVVEKSRRPGGGAALHSHLIGRANDLAQLQSALWRVRQHNQNHIAVITGEAGLGKSRLVSEFCRVAAQAEARVYQGSCLSYARSRPLWVIIDLLQDIVQLSDTGSSRNRLKTLQTYLKQRGLASDDIYPYLVYALGLEEQLEPQFEARLRMLDAAMLQRQTHAALRQVFLTEARLAPTVLVFEDLHWIDQASRDFLEYLILTSSDIPLLLVLVSRLAERETVIQPLLAAAAKEPDRLVDLELTALSEKEGQLMVDYLIKQTNADALALKQNIVRRAEGNPLYIEEIIRMLVDQGGLVRATADGSWQVTPRASSLLRTVPGTVRGLILARFDRLPENVRYTLQKAAVLGTSFPVSLLHVLNYASADRLNSHLDQLETRQFLAAQPFRSEPGYCFQHALLQETIYGTLLKRDRCKIHYQVAQGIERSNLWLPEEQAEVLSYHYFESTNPILAVPYLITAAENADRRCAYETAIEHYRRAMKLLTAQSEDRNEQYFRAGIGLGRALKFIGKLADANQLLTEILQQLWQWEMATKPDVLQPVLVEGLRQLADVRQREGSYDAALSYLEAGLQALGEAGATDKTQAWHALMERKAWIRFRQGQLEEANALASEAIADLNSADTDDPVKLAALYNTLGGIAWQQGRLDEAIANVDLSLRLFESVGYLWGMAIAYGNLGVLYYNFGRWSKAAEFYERAYSVWQIIGSPEGQAVSFDNLGLLRMSMGSHESALKDLETGLTIRQRLGDTWGMAQSHINLALLALTRSSLDAAAEHAHISLTMGDTIGASEIQLQARWILAQVQAANGEVSTGLKSAEQALTMAQNAGLVEKEAECLRIVGVLYGQVGRYQDAEKLLRQSVSLSVKQNNPYRQGHALMELGRLFQRLARTDDSTKTEWLNKAQAMLHQAIEKFQRIGALHDLQLAQAALVQI